MKKGLGRGLESLMGVSAALEQETVNNTPKTEIDIDLIDVNKEQARKAFDEEKLKELSESIKMHGIIQPLILTEKNGRYTIVAGERRYRAARMAGIKKVPAAVRSFEEEKLLELSLIENIQREDLNPVEEGRAILKLMQEHGFTQETVALRIGRSRSAVANTLRLLSLPEAVLELVKNGELTAGHARTLVSLKDEEQIMSAARYMMENGISVRAAEEYVKALTEPKKEAPKKTSAKSAEMKYAERVISENLDTKVQISGSASKGKIVINYYSDEQLQALYEFLTKA